MQMATNLALDDKLIRAAQKAGGHRTKKAAVTAALEEYVRRRKQLELRGFFGKVDYEEGYDHKRGRRR
jgi:Arc/MetJ family transcription regulator